MNVGKVAYETYRPNGALTFILTEDKTIVKTNLQTFVVRYDHRNYVKQLRILRQLIRENKMNSVVDLVDYCKFRPGNNSQMKGLELRETKLERYL